MSLKGSAESYTELKGSISLPKAIQGKSAYEIALLNGFKGTEAEWLKSLTGTTAYEYAVKNGFVGTEEEYAAWCVEKAVAVVQTVKSVKGGGTNVWTITLEGGVQSNLEVRNGEDACGVSAEIVDGVLVVKKDYDSNLKYLHLNDVVTGKVNSLYVENGKLIIAESED